MMKKIIALICVCSVLFTTGCSSFVKGFMDGVNGALDSNSGSASTESDTAAVSGQSHSDSEVKTFIAQQAEAGVLKQRLIRFTGYEYKTGIPDEKIDRELVDKLLAERDVICSLAVKSLQRLYDNGFRFTVPEDTRTMLESYHREDISLSLFIEQHCRISANSAVHKKDFMSAYNRFCMENYFKPYKPTEISQFINANFPAVNCERFVQNGKYLWGWKGLELNKEEQKNDT